MTDQPVMAIWWIIWAPEIWWAAVQAAMPQILTAAAVFGASIALSYALRPKGIKQDSTPIDLSRFPTIMESKPYPIVFGTVRIDGYDTAWTGHRKVEEHERSGVIVYRRYYAGAHLIYCQGPVDGLKQLWYGDGGGGKIAWPDKNTEATYAADGTTTATVSAGSIYGGPYDGGQGGIEGTIDILYGSSSQGQNSYMVARLGSDIPAYRGLCSLVCRQIEWGLAPYPMTLGALWKRTTILTDGTAQWYSAKATIGTFDLNAAHILRECYTNTDWGEGMSSDELGTTWTTVADTLYDESAGLSGAYIPEPGNLRQFIAVVCQIVDAIIYDDPVTEKLEIALIRDDYELDELPSFDEKDFVVVGSVKPHWRDVPGRVLIKFTDRQHPDVGGQADYTDRSIISRQGRVVEQTFDYPLICLAALANDVAARKGRAMTSLGRSLTLQCKRTMAGLHRGSLFKLAYDDADLYITQMVVRVASIRDGGSADETLEMTVVEDIYAQAYTIVGNPPATQWVSSSASMETITSTSLSGSPSSSVSASASGTPSASKSSSPSASISGTPSASKSASRSSSPSMSKSASPSSSASA